MKGSRPRRHRESLFRVERDSPRHGDSPGSKTTSILFAEPNNGNRSRDTDRFPVFSGTGVGAWMAEWSLSVKGKNRCGTIMIVRAQGLELQVEVEDRGLKTRRKHGLESFRCGNVGVQRAVSRRLSKQKRATGVKDS